MTTPESVIEIGESIGLRRAGGESLVLGPGLSVLAWYRQTFCAAAGTAGDARSGESEESDHPVPDGSNGVLFLPRGEGGSFFGMTSQTHLAECTRAVHEGLVHAAVAALHEHSGQPLSLGLVGPGAGNALWCELFAKAAGIPVTADGRTFRSEQSSIDIHTALHALHLRCTAVISGLEVAE